MMVILAVLGVAPASFASPNPKFHLQTTLRGDVVCRQGKSAVRGHQPLKVEIPLKILIKNTSKQSAVTGKLGVINERLYHRLPDGKLKSFRTTTVPDEFEISFFPGDGFPDIANEEMSAGAEKTLEVNSYIHFDSDDIEWQAGKRVLLVSFHVTNVLHNGDGKDYWTEPMPIVLPDRCSLD
jgi:hypothetical protein